MDQVTAMQTADDRRRARVTVEASARQGHAPTATYPADDLAWAGFTPEELERLDAQAAEAREQKAAAEEKRQQSRALRLMTERVLQELEQEEAAKRRAKAEKIARERLGLK